MDWAFTLTQIRNRLPELEHQILKLDAHFPLHVLPKGLFRDVTNGADCIADILKDLEKMMNAKTSDRVRLHWSNLLSQKIHVLVHICRNHPLQKGASTEFTLEKMGTRRDWLAQIKAKQLKLTTQRASIAETLDKMQERKDKEAILALQKELLDIDAQLRNLGCV